jgi:uncharacterized protein (TIGR03086 family)
VTADLPALFAGAVGEFDRRFRAIGADQWGAATPDTEWDVRALANHLLVEDLWAPPLLDGLTIAEVGDRFDGDQLGDDPLEPWSVATAASVAAVAAGDLERIVHLSFGDFPAEMYVSQLVCDHVIHAWDLARAIGADERLDPDLVDFVWGFISPQVEDWRTAGAFGPRVHIAEGADRQSALLALSGRRP